jgi:hypothetical protein
LKTRLVDNDYPGTRVSRNGIDTAVEPIAGFDSGAEKNAKRRGYGLGRYNGRLSALLSNFVLSWAQLSELY